MSLQHIQVVFQLVIQCWVTSKVSYFMVAFMTFEALKRLFLTKIFNLKIKTLKNDPKSDPKEKTQNSYQKKCKFLKTQKTAHNLESTPRIYSKTHHKKLNFHTLVTNFNYFKIGHMTSCLVRLWFLLVFNFLWIWRDQFDIEI